VRIETHAGPREVAILIPTRQRADVVVKQLKKMPFLNHSDVFYGLDNREAKSYAATLANAGLGAVHCTFVMYRNEQHSVGFCRDQLRLAGLKRRPKFDLFVVTDDNAVFKEESLTNLVRCSVEYPVQPNLTSGSGELMRYYASGKGGALKDLRVINDLRSFERVTHIFTAVPRIIYRRFAYPVESLAAEDRYRTMWALSHGIFAIRECLDAPYSKPRQQPGGTGGAEERMRATGLGFAKLAQDFPVFVGCTGSTPARWSLIMQIAKGYTFAGKLPGGSNRVSEDELISQMVKKE